MMLSNGQTDVWTRSWILNGVRAAVTALIAAPLFVGLSALWAQDNAAARVEQAAARHGQGWRNGKVKNWLAGGTITLYRRDDKGRRQFEAFPMTLIHATDQRGGGGKADKVQRLIFQAPKPPALGTGTAKGLDKGRYAPNKILIKEGTDGTEQWRTSGTLTMRAAGGSGRFIEAQTVRSVEALLNFAMNGKALNDVTATILSRGPAIQDQGNAKKRDGSFVIPDFEAAKNKHVIETTDALTAPGGQSQATRYYVDDASSLVTRMEFDYGAGQEMVSRQSMPLTEVWEFSDYRDVLISSSSPVTGRGDKNSSETVKFPFRIDRYVMGQKIETMTFQRVLLNQNLRPENFRR